MEHKCKIGGKNFRDGNVVAKEDRISELPEVLLLQILTSLQTKDIIATSVLSKRWRSLWKMVPRLKFDSDDHDHTFSEDVYRSLISHKAPFLESLDLTLSDESYASDIGTWIGIAFARHVRKLVFSADLEVRFPSVLFSWNDTLEMLNLRRCVLVDFPTRVSLVSLRKLHLYHVQFFDEASICNLLSGCPVLEDLAVTRISNWVVVTFTIAVPSLQMLTIEDEERVEGEGGYVINAPSLRYLNLKVSGFARLEFCLIENAPEFVEAKIEGIHYITNENILESLTSAKRLSLDVSPLAIKHPTGKIFYQLLSLELRIRTHEKEWWNLLSLMLDSSPQLQVLKLNGSTWYGTNPLVVGKWNQPKRVPECLLYHLETFVWTRYQWQREADKEVATYILENARMLKKATLSTDPIESKEFRKLEKRRERLNEFSSVVKASDSCHLVLESDTYSSE